MKVELLLLFIARVVSPSWSAPNHGDDDEMSSILLAHIRRSPRKKDTAVLNSIRHPNINSGSFKEMDDGQNLFINDHRHARNLQPCNGNLTVAVLTDDFPEETNFQIIEYLSDGEEVVHVSTFAQTLEAATWYSGVVECVSDISCYRVTLVDSIGDGFTKVPSGALIWWKSDADLDDPNFAVGQPSGGFDEIVEEFGSCTGHQGTQLPPPPTSSTPLDTACAGKAVREGCQCFDSTVACPEGNTCDGEEQNASSCYERTSWTVSWAK